MRVIYIAMTVITIQEQTHMLPAVPCVICQSFVPSHHVTTGSLYADGTQAYACQQHMRDRLQWIMGWLQFERSQHAMGDRP
jgi:hypothetical protein